MTRVDFKQIYQYIFPIVVFNLFYHIITFNWEDFSPYPVFMGVVVELVQFQQLPNVFIIYPLNFFPTYRKWGFLLNRR